MTMFRLFLNAVSLEVLSDAIRNNEEKILNYFPRPPPRSYFSKIAEELPLFSSSILHLNPPIYTKVY